MESVESFESIEFGERPNHRPTEPPNGFSSEMVCNPFPPLTHPYVIESFDRSETAPDPRFLITPTRMQALHRPLRERKVMHRFPLTFRHVPKL